jgi:hypothetical protein
LKLDVHFCGIVVIMLPTTTMAFETKAGNNPVLTMDGNMNKSMGKPVCPTGGGTESTGITDNFTTTFAASMVTGWKSKSVESPLCVSAYDTAVGDDDGSMGPFSGDSDRIDPDTLHDYCDRLCSPILEKDCKYYCTKR